MLLPAHPMVAIHAIATSSSWLHLVERWFAEITGMSAPRGTHRGSEGPVHPIRTGSGAGTLVTTRGTGPPTGSSNPSVGR